jgi:hypothetical protein
MKNPRLNDQLLGLDFSKRPDLAARLRADLAHGNRGRSCCGRKRAIRAKYEQMLRRGK